MRRRRASLDAARSTACATAPTSCRSRFPTPWQRGEARASHDHAVEGARRAGRPAGARARAPLARAQRRARRRARDRADALPRRAASSASARSRSSPDGSTSTMRCWRPRRPAPRRAGSPRPAIPSCCTLWSLLGFPALTLPVGRRRTACRSACSSPRRRTRRLAARRARRGARRGSVSRLGVAASDVCLMMARVMKRAKRHAPPQPPEGAQSGGPLAAARQGRAARQDDAREAPAGQRRAAQARAVTRTPKSDPHHALPRRPRGGADARALHGRGRRRGPRARRRAALRVADGDAGGEAERRGLVGVRVRVAAVESAVPGRRSAAGDAARPAPALLPVVARLARHARNARASCWRSTAAARAGRRVPAAGAARDRRAASAVAARDGRRVVPSAMGGACKRASASIVALAFVVKRDHPQYAGKLPIDERGARHRQCGRRVRLVARLPRAHARRARRARHRRSVSRARWPSRDRQVAARRRRARRRR